MVNVNGDTVQNLDELNENNNNQDLNNPPANFQQKGDKNNKFKQFIHYLSKTIYYL